MSEHGKWICGCAGRDCPDGACIEDQFTDDEYVIANLQDKDIGTLRLSFADGSKLDIPAKNLNFMLIGSDKSIKVCKFTEPDRLLKARVYEPGQIKSTTIYSDCTNPGF